MDPGRAEIAERLAAIRTEIEAACTRAGRDPADVTLVAVRKAQPIDAIRAALKPMVTSIIDGSASPLATVRWPKGAVEPVIDAYDTKRLK